MSWRSRHESTRKTLFFLLKSIQAYRNTENQPRIGGGDLAVPIGIGGKQLHRIKRLKTDRRPQRKPGIC